MSTAFQRGIVLFNQNRHDLADREFRQELAESPDNELAHAFLALCLLEQNRKDEALREADEAIRLDPGTAFCHYVRGRVLCNQDRLKDAGAAAQEAIQLDPSVADYPGLLASIEIGRSRWEAALAAADRGLALDPEHNMCINLRALALVQLGRKAEADQTLGSALANDPENALTHANQGWALLHRGDHQRALEHFREALRIDPELEWARAGIVEALKARHLIYRQMLRFFLWMGRQTRVAQWVVVLGFIFGRQALASLARANPALAPFVIPILVLSFAFLMLTWISSPLFNLALRFNRFGRLALSREQRIASSWIGGCFLVAAASFLVYLVLPKNALASFCMVYFGLLLLPLAVTFGRPPGRARWLMVAYTCVMALMGLPILSLILFDRASPWKNVDLAFNLFEYFVYGAILSTWMPALMRSGSWAQS
jgi:tetratricopeptide (TPR) repeat protein